MKSDLIFDILASVPISMIDFLVYSSTGVQNSSLDNWKVVKVLRCTKLSKFNDKVIINFF